MIIKYIQAPYIQWLLTQMIRLSNHRYLQNSLFRLSFLLSFSCHYFPLLSLSPASLLSLLTLSSHFFSSSPSPPPPQPGFITLCGAKVYSKVDVDGHEVQDDYETGECSQAHSHCTFTHVRMYVHPPFGPFTC